MRYSNDKAKSTSGIPHLLSKAWRLRSQCQHAEAARVCQKIISLQPYSGEAWHLAGILAMDKGQYGQSVGHLKQAITVEPGQALHHNNLGVALNHMRRYAEAVDHLKQALKIDGAYLDAQCNLGLAYYHQGQLNLAAQSFKSIIAIHPEHDAALANFGLTCLAQHNPAEAAQAYKAAIAIDCTQPAWHGNLAAAYMRMGRFKAAIQCYDQAIKLNPAEVGYYVNLGIALRAVGDLPGSIASLEMALSITPKHPPALAHLVVGLEYTCQWEKLDLLYPLLNRCTQIALKKNQPPDEDPMLNIRRSSDPRQNQSVARAWSQRIKNYALRVLPCFSHPRHRHAEHRIVLGYLSNDFRNHPVAHQLFPLFGHHDRSRFRVIAFSMGPDDGSDFRNEIRSGCDEFVDISNMGLDQAARSIYNRRVDILVDLMGHSHHNRMEILALRPAPVQVSYLGYLSTIGADYIDYLVADPIVAPFEHNKFFDEKLIRLPQCYQMNHTVLLEKMGAGQPGDWGLPPDGFIFCCFNSAYKIDRRLFDCWMRILKACPQSVLWLSKTNKIAATHMSIRAAQSGVDPERLIFAEKIALKAHLQRLPLAHLALDTVRYNGGATTANALSVGLPVLTVLGSHWVSRMSASHLIAAGLPEMVCDDLASYEITAIELARDPDRLRSLSERITNRAKTGALFNNRAFVRHLESGYETIWSLHQKGRPATHIDVPNSLNNSAEPICPQDNIKVSLPSKKTTCRNKPPLYKSPTDPSRNTIYYCCPDSNEPSAGIRRLYRHVAILNAAGISASILHSKAGFRLHDLADVPVQYMAHISHDPHAIFVIPGGLPAMMHQLKNHPGRRFVIALNWHNIFSSLPQGTDWRQMNIERVLVVSPAIGDLISWSMGIPTHQLASSIDHRHYCYNPQNKRPQVAYIKRKGRNIDKLKRLICSRNDNYINKIKWVGLEGLSEDRYAAEICQSSVYLTTSMAEGYPTSILQAMAAGAIVAGYDAVGGRQILCGQGPNRNCILAPNGDYLSLAYSMAPLLNDLLKGRTQKWAPLVANALQTASTATMKEEADSVISFWHKYTGRTAVVDPNQPHPIVGQQQIEDRCASAQR